MRQINGEQHWHRLGDVALLFLDTLGARMAPDGDLRPDAPLLGPQQWRLVNDALSDPAVSWLVVVSATPLVDAGAVTAPPAGAG